MPPLDPDVADPAPSDLALTPYDQEHAVTYMRLLDPMPKVPTGARSRRFVLHVDPEREPDRARRAFDSHLAVPDG